jgi:phenylpropionate dioxygenase-like ring-hydroxylating dioxygenase large terminal subunit
MGMSQTISPESLRRPPSFEESQNRRQKARAAGMNPDYWYPVEWAGKVKRGQVIGTRFWKQEIAVFRGEDGSIHAVEDRCAHRQLRLSTGQVEGCNLTCGYHGWQFDGSGRCAHIPHDLFGNRSPEFRLKTYPIQEKHGLIWIFPGDPELASARKIPEIPEITGPNAWGAIPVDFQWKAHHSMIMDNVSDFTHAYLHRRSRPFYDAKLTRLETVGDTVHLEYDTQVGTGKISGLFVNRSRTNTDHMELAYEYPYQRSNTDNRIKHWCFVLPMDEQTTRSFFIFYFHRDMLQLPLLPVHLPQLFIHRVVMPIARRILVRPLLAEDGWAVEEEQRGYNRHFNMPIAELNPAVQHFQQLTIRKWEEHLAKGSAPRAKSRESRPAHEASA